MSWKACAYVKELRDGLIITEKFVLLILAEYHRTDEKLAWPSVETLAYDCLMTERGVYQILARLEKKDFIRRTKGGGRGMKSGYQIVGVDVKKGEPQTLNIETVFPDSVNETLHSHALNPERNPAQPTYRNKEEPVLEPVLESNGEELPPADMHGMQCAQVLVGRLHAAQYELQSSPGLMRAIAGAHEALVFTGKSPPVAFEFLVAVTLDAIDGGKRIDKFFYEDAKWRGEDGKQKQPAVSASAARQQRVRENLVAAARTHVARRA